jgi:hypothetical protein
MWSSARQQALLKPLAAAQFLAKSSFGVLNTQGNLPRRIGFSARLNF